MGLRCCANYLAGFMQICSEITKGSRKRGTPSFVLSSERLPARLRSAPRLLFLRLRRACNVLDGLNGKHNGQDKQQNS